MSGSARSAGAVRDALAHARARGQRKIRDIHDSHNGSSQVLVLMLGVHGSQKLQGMDLFFS